MNRNVSTLLKVVLGVILLGILLKVVEFEQIWEVAVSADVSLLLVAVALLPVNVGLETAIWRSVTQQLKIEASWNQLLDAVMAGFTLGAVTPARVGEFAGRSYLLNPDDRWKGAFALALSRQPELCVLGIAGCAGLVIFLLDQTTAPAPLWGVVGVGLIATTFVSVVSFKPVLLKPLTLKFGKYVSFFPSSALAADLDSVRLIEALFLSAARYVVFSLQFYLLVRAFGIALPPLDVSAIIASIFLLRFIIPPVTFMDIGIREGASIFLFGIAGASTAGAFNAAFILFAINIVLPALLGIFSARKLVATTFSSEPSTDVVS
ncbi:MAG: flippase-like domain-containing protein [Rhodothermales bacterium]|nr:flippase-like domain-containing protein [Rhodothermales bacterium]